MSVRNYKTVEITASCIVKTYNCDDAEARVQHLTNIYALLGHRNVPNTDRIVHIKDKALYLAPRGIAGPPKTQMDLRECVVCVLETLAVGVVNWFVYLWGLKFVGRCFMRSRSFTAIYGGPTLFETPIILVIGFSLIGRMQPHRRQKVSNISIRQVTRHAFWRTTMVLKLIFGVLAI
jgi:hypothetical protein